MTASISFKKSHRQVSGNKKTLPVSRPVQALNRNHPKAHMVFWQYRGSSSFVLKEGKFRTYAQQALWLPAGFDHDVYVDADAVLLRFSSSRNSSLLPQFYVSHAFSKSTKNSLNISWAWSKVTRHSCSIVENPTSMCWIN